ncbi:MAG: hypothetical protein LBU83_07135, partial [Bacteroidales bacterium]|nr:hypothetical protein [Bacteroidales bacterium]
MKRLILILVLSMTVFGLQAQDLLRPDSSRLRWFMKPPPINEIIKPSSFTPFQDINNFKKNPWSISDTLPATWSQFKCAFLDLPLPEEFALVERFYRNMEMGKNYPTPLWYDPEEDHLRTVNILREIGGYVGSESGGGGLSTSIIQPLYDR